MFDTAGALQAGFFERVAWPGNDIRDMIIESNWTFMAGWRQR